VFPLLTIGSFGDACSSGFTPPGEPLQKKFFVEGFDVQ
jgi:hypothetical protein